MVEMSTLLVVKPGEAALHRQGIDGRQVALQIDHEAERPCGSRSCRAAAIRSEPEGSAGSVTMASPPWLRTTSAISFSAAATSTWPTLASTARLQTCTIIGIP